MAKTKALAIICIKDSIVKQRVDQMGNPLNIKELEELMDIGLEDEISPWYCPVIFCDNGSIMYKRLQSNN